MNYYCYVGKKKIFHKNIHTFFSVQQSIKIHVDHIYQGMFGLLEFTNKYRSI